MDKWFDLSIRLKKGRRIALAAALAALPVPRSAAFAGTFTLIEGKKYELCREYAKNLAAFPDLTDQTYEWPLNPKLLDFKKPRWKTIDVREHMDIIKKLYIWSNDPLQQADDAAGEFYWQRQSNSVAEEIDKGAVRLERAHADFDNDGQTDIVYRYYHPLLPEIRENADTRQIAGYWYIYVSGRDIRISEKFRGNVYPTSLYDSFFFKGRFYLIGWVGGDLFVIELRGWEAKDLAFTPVCKFRYAQ
jgi:hypothetical protein